MHCTKYILAVVNFAFAVLSYVPLKSWKHSLNRRCPPLLSSLGNTPTLSPRNTTSTGASSKTLLSLEKINDMKASINIIDVIDTFNLEKFERKGPDRAVAVCPFHNDHNPSLSIDRNRKMYKCFSCGEGGDVFRFVREFNKLQGKELSFWQSVKEVTDLMDINTGSIIESKSMPEPTMTPEQRQELERRKMRMSSANAAAAAFYADCLTKVFAGGARLYLHSRGFQPKTTRAFGIGFAPDSYFSGNKLIESSLVDHLKSLNFTANEIIDAGLAVVKKTKSMDSSDEVYGHDHEESDHGNINQDERLHHDAIMDRFRGRVVVPIFDATGKRILGFGGRILPQDEESKDFPMPKYLNSPESLVFLKRKILFAQHMARRATLRSSNTLPVVIVEGYMDTIALWTVGIDTATATMGTSISPEQLTAAANVAGHLNSRIILCLDNDAAGRKATERLCTSDMIAKLLKNKPVEVKIATLPSSVKDPADFIAYQVDQGLESHQISEIFRTQVLDNALDWTDWYIQSLCDSFNATKAKDSFGEIFERVATFMAKSMSPSVRKNKAFSIAGFMTKLKYTPATEADAYDAFQRQLESDLIDLSSRLAQAQDVLEERSMKFNEISASSVVSSLSRGYGPSGEDESDVLSSRALGITPSNSASVQAGDTKRMPRKRARVSSFNQEHQKKLRPSKGASRPKSKALTPHFAGFEFSNECDIDWLGISREKSKQGKNELIFGRKALERYSKPFQRSTMNPHLMDQSPLSLSGGKPIYFNSNDYHGHKFLTNQALQAGYSNRRIKADLSFMERGVASLVQVETFAIASEAEAALLRLLVRSQTARIVTKNTLQARSAVNSRAQLSWTATERQWLFEQLVTCSDRIPIDCANTTQLREFLASQPDVPKGYFGTKYNVKEKSGNEERIAGSGETYETSILGDYNGDYNAGLLDPLFYDSDQLSELTSHMAIEELNALDELRAQELIATMLLASTAERANTIRRDIISASKSLVYSGDQNTTLFDLPSSEDNATDMNEFRFQVSSLTRDLHEVTRDLISLTESSRRIAGRILDKRSSNGLEGHVSTSLQLELGKALDEHLHTILHSDIPATGSPVLPSADDDEPYEEALERMQSEWGEWYDEESTYEDIRKTRSNVVNKYDDAFGGQYPEEDDLEEVLVRIDREWERWE